MADVRLSHVSKRFADGTIAVDDISLHVQDQEFVVLVGPSGCGKSTTLRLIAGLETPSGGDIYVGSQRVNARPAAKRDIAMVFQNYALYPHMTVYGNLSFGIRLQNKKGVIRRVGLGGKRRSSTEAFNGETISQRVQRVAQQLEIEHLLKRRPHQLSGGERQRVALGRAIVRNPAAFLFDEPLSNLDAKLRVEMRSQLKALHQALNATMIYVTHDQIEAMTLGDKIAVMNQGRIQQLDTPKQVYRNPANCFVAEFIGSLPMNLIRGNIVTLEEKKWFQANGLKRELMDWEAGSLAEGPVVVGVRGEEIKIGSSTNNKIESEGSVEDVDQLGDSQLVTISLSGDNDPPITPTGSTKNSQIIVRTEPTAEIGRRQKVVLDWSQSRWHWFEAPSGKRIKIES